MIIFGDRANRMTKELEEGPAADRAWYQQKAEKKKSGADEDAKPKVTKTKQKRNEAKSISTKESDFFAMEAKRGRKLKKIRAFVEKNEGRGGKEKPGKTNKNNSWSL